MKTNDYKILEKCIDRGTNYGYNRAFNHNDIPSRADITDAIIQEIMNEICEYFIFEDIQK